MLDLGRFRLDFPEFADSPRYPDTLLEFWATLGERVICETRFGDAYVYALSLFTAHNIVLAAGNSAAAAACGIPGAVSGPVASKAVGSVNVSYDNASVMLPGAGHWNQTTYGRQFTQLIRLFGHGCVQL